MTAAQPIQPPRRRRRGLVALLVLLTVVAVAAVLVLVWMNWKGPSRDPRPVADPITVTPNEPFELGGFSYAADWDVRVLMGELTASELYATNTGEDLAYPLIGIVLEQEAEQVAMITCQGSGLKSGESVLMQCRSDDDPPTEYDRIVVVDRH